MEYENLAYPTQGFNMSTSNQSNNQSSNNSNDNQWSSEGTNNNNNQKSLNTTTLPDLSSKLGKDGKLLPEECQRRIDQGLCLLCASKGHMIKDCPRSSSSNTKARSTKSSSDTEAEDSTAEESN